jgi:hypothetical protein
VPCHPRILSHHRSRRMWCQVTLLWTILSTLMSKLTTFMETSLRSARNSEHAVRTTSLADKAWSRTTFSRCAEQPENMWNFVSTSSWPRIDFIKSTSTSAWWFDIVECWRVVGWSLQWEEIFTFITCINKCAYGMTICLPNVWICDTYEAMSCNAILALTSLRVKICPLRQ